MLFKKSGAGAMFTPTGAPQAGALCIYQNVAVFCAKNLRNIQDLQENAKGGNPLKKACTIIR